MSTKLREKANSFDRIVRQKSNDYLKDAEKISLRIMDIAYDKNFETLLVRLDKLKSATTQTRCNIEYGSFLSMPTLRSGRRSQTEVPTNIENEISQLLFAGELILLECRNLSGKLQNVERTIYKVDEFQVLDVFEEAEEVLRRIDHLHRSRCSSDIVAFETIVSDYKEMTNYFEDLAEKENLSALENNHLAGAFSINKGSLFKRFISTVKNKPVFEKEITDAILIITNRLKTTTGGIVRLQALYSMVKSANNSLNISINDIERVVNNLAERRIIQGLRTFGGTKVVELVPVTATPDTNTILELASENGKLSIESVLFKTKWTHERANRALKQMEEFGLVEYDLISRQWIFPTFSQEVGVTDKKYEGDE